MVEITAVYSDIGGVILTNGWDAGSRNRAASTFGLDWEDFERRHAALVTDFEKGKLSFDQYLARTVFYRPRTFKLEEFKEFVYAESRLIPATSEVVFAVSRTHKYLMAALNNESLELNRYRIEKFGLRARFELFFSSCFVGAVKPLPDIYRIALQVTQRRPEECVFIDDRPENVEGARQAGMHGVLCLNAGQLRRELEDLGVAVEVGYAPQING